MFGRLSITYVQPGQIILLYHFNENTPPATEEIHVSREVTQL